MYDLINEFFTLFLYILWFLIFTAVIIWGILKLDNWLNLPSANEERKRAFETKRMEDERKRMEDRSIGVRRRKWRLRSWITALPRNTRFLLNKTTKICFIEGLRTSYAFQTYPDINNEKPYGIRLTLDASRETFYHEVSHIRQFLEKEFQAEQSAKRLSAMYLNKKLTNWC